jgi:hypothetical protein
MSIYLKQANSNEVLLEELEKKFPNDYFDWKITISFYIAIHYLKHLASIKKIDLGGNHIEIGKSVNPKHGKMPLTQTAYNNYDNLLQESMTARYLGITFDESTHREIMKANYIKCTVYLKNFRLYILDMEQKRKVK